MTDQSFGPGRPDYSGRGAHGAHSQPPYAPGLAGAGIGAPAGAAGYPAPRQFSDSKGFFAALFDFGFTSFVTPKIIKVLYVLIMIMAGLSALVFVIVMFAVQPVFGILALLFFAPAYFLIVMGVYRISLEFFTVIFRIAEDIRSIREHGGFPQ